MRFSRSFSPVLFPQACVTWNRSQLFSRHPQEVSDVQFPDVEVDPVPLKLFDQLLLPVLAAAARTSPYAKHTNVNWKHGLSTQHDIQTGLTRWSQ